MKKRPSPATRHTLYRAAALGVVIVTGVSCRAETRSDKATVGDSVMKKSGPVPPAAGQYTRKDFARLQWLEGRWRGRLPDGRSFYERYRFLDDSTIAMRSFADSTFAVATDSARITLRAGTVADQGRARWIVTRLDSTGVDFASEHDASNNFTWAPASPNSWKAILNSIDRNGRAQTVVYPMQRIRRQSP
jgi:hypothetical protein